MGCKIVMPCICELYHEPKKSRKKKNLSSINKLNDWKSKVKYRHEDTVVGRSGSKALIEVISNLYQNQQ